MRVKTKGQMHPVELDISLLEKGAMVYNVLNHKLRQQLIRYIGENGEITVSVLYEELGIVQSEASRYLGILRKAGFVNTRRDSKYIYYSVNHQKLKEVHEITRQLIK